jgi:translation initiation factor 3 subunit H
MDKEQDLAKLSLEELIALGKKYGLDDDSRIKLVQLDALVIMKIIKHCRENLPELVTGQLLGLDFGTTLEVTNCFPFPLRTDDEEELEAEAGAEYQMEMMRRLREVNIDHNAVGWYTSTYLSHFPYGSIKDQFKYQSDISKCVVIVYDSLKTSQGELAIKAYRLTDAFMDFYGSANFTQESLASSRLAFNRIFEEIPIKITNSSLLKSFLFELENSKAVEKGTEFERLDLTINPFLEKNLEVLIQCVDDFANEQNKFQIYQRNLAKQQQYINKKKQQGLTEEELNVKPLQPPSQLESLLLTNQISNYCDQINSFASHSADKLYLLQGLADEGPSTSTSS